MFVPFNGAQKSFLSSTVKLTLNEAISLLEETTADSYNTIYGLRSTL